MQGIVGVLGGSGDELANEIGVVVSMPVSTVSEISCLGEEEEKEEKEEFQSRRPQLIHAILTGLLDVCICHNSSCRPDGTNGTDDGFSRTGMLEVLEEIHGD